ncbi:MBL fold hydrolase [Actinocatenispora thailandica]|uniref:MBL fold hydrolase n=1 Tax=Actinocatenispora thailandica TaxID=227318 RepID=A0A7R7DLR7_9ACTN|nr:MBL fold metallo-hydrolase [Actinocatenispora thailandica]BCJ34045.1 MBL fold hydrolase [Actinocatenispora thailandica]
MSTLRFLGAAGTVTGSRFLIDSGARRVLVDCGMYQGDAALRRRNWRPFPVEVAGIDAVVVSHAHLDHIGLLPRLVRAGYTGPVYCSPHTAELARIVLTDAAHLQEEDARYAARHGYSRHDPPLPLYTHADAARSLELLRPTPFGTPVPIGDELTVTLSRAGHILGSACVLLDTGADGRVLFSGDLGRADHPLLRPPDPPPAADQIVVESTYGNRRHPLPDLAGDAALINAALRRGGSVLVPCFAVDRTEILLVRLAEMVAAGLLPRVPVYVDSPMALAALRVYRQAVRSRSAELRPALLDAATDPFDPGELHLAHSVEESARLNEPRQPCIILSAAGMATGGRVVHHLMAQLPDPRNLVLLPGYQVPGTRGARLLSGATAIKAYGRYVPVRAQVVGLGEFSAHADADAILSWLGHAPGAPETCFVVHGEPAAATELARRIRQQLDWCTVVPREDERVGIHPVRRHPAPASTEQSTSPVPRLPQPRTASNAER